MSGSPDLSQHALAMYVEPLAVRRRVLVLGGDDAVAERLIEVGAREARWVPSGEDLDRFPSGSFDLALVTDLGEFEEPARLLSAIGRIVGDAGAALVAAANRDVAAGHAARAFDYYELFDLVAGEFADVRMVAQVPFHGLVLAELGLDDDAPAVSVDTQLAGEPQAPLTYVALASQRGISLEPYAIYELPPPPSPEAPPPDEELVEGVRSELASEKLRADALAAQVEALRGQAARVAELEREVVARGRAVTELSNEIESLRAAAAQIEELARRADRAERSLARVEPELERVAEAHAAELHRFEAALRERAAAVRVLEGEVSRRDRMIQELIATVEENAPGGGPTVPPGPAPSDELLEENSRLRERLDLLAAELARREGDAQATGWKVAELERRLSEGPSRAPTVAAAADRSRELAEALDQIDALRRALTQEHEQRVRAESALGRPANPTAEPPV
jgi:hypothetical protein